HMPGGVSSPVRAFRAVGGEPLMVGGAEGARFHTVDGRTLVDFCCSWGPLILGHAHPEVVEALREATARGTSYGITCPEEVDLAERVCALYPGLDQVRFVSSGTEATMSALRLARGVTGRDLVVKFSGCYHGHADHLLVAAGSGLATFGTPNSAGVPEAFASLTRVLPLDDEAALEELFAREGGEIAAVIVEPVPANNGLLLQRPEYLRRLRELTARHGALLIFDEVISGFRLGPGGAAERYDITPDLAAFGKVIGGGLPVGAFGGRAELMEHLAPQGDVYQAGTLSGNPLAMTAGLATLRVLEREDGWRRLAELGRKLEERLAPVLEGASVPVSLVRAGSIFWLSLQDGPPPRSAEAIEDSAADRYRRLFHSLVDAGVYLAPSAFEVGFLSLAHSTDEIDRLAEGLGGALAAAGEGES
ncbi:MAG: glutamate-1-semialdehyde 2,1-aminomutase, partial [Acidobacteriota bacterium]